MKPTYKHDCDNCQYLGKLIWEDKNHKIQRRDVYIYKTSYGAHIISRYGDRGPEYETWIGDLTYADPGIIAGVVAAIKRGLLTPDELTDPFTH